MVRKRLAILTTHPIQYQVPWFRALAAHPAIDLQVFFCHQVTPKEHAAAGFGVEFAWDVPLLDGYSYRFLKNVARNEALHSFGGLDTPEIKEIIAKAKFDAVLVCGWHFKSAWQAFRACWRTKTPLMIRGDSHLHTGRSGLKKMIKWPLYRWLIPKFDACLAVGQWSRDYYLHYGACPERIFFVPHVVDESYFLRKSLELNPVRAELREQWGIESDSVVFLFAGKFIEKKRPMDFIQAINHSARRNEKIMGLMVGDGPLRLECETLVREDRMPVRFTGFLNQSQMAQAYVAADSLILQSEGETWGLVVNEAMYCGRACIVSDKVGCGPDLVRPGQTGSIFPVCDIDSLAGILNSFAQDRSNLNAMGDRAREVMREYSIDVAVSGTISAMNAVSSGLK